MNISQRAKQTQSVPQINQPEAHSTAQYSFRQSNGAKKTSDQSLARHQLKILPIMRTSGREENNRAPLQPIRAADRSAHTTELTNHQDRNPSGGKDPQRASTRVRAPLESIVIDPIGDLHHNITLNSFDLPIHHSTQTVHITGRNKAA